MAHVAGRHLHGAQFMRIGCNTILHGEGIRQGGYTGGWTWPFSRLIVLPVVFGALPHNKNASQTGLTCQKSCMSTSRKKTLLGCQK